jgi:hypothetical protein
MIALAGYYKLKCEKKENVFADLKLNGIASLGIEED